MERLCFGDYTNVILRIFPSSNLISMAPSPPIWLPLSPNLLQRSRRIAGLKNFASVSLAPAQTPPMRIWPAQLQSLSRLLIMALAWRASSLLPQDLNKFELRLLVTVSSKPSKELVLLSLPTLAALALVNGIGKISRRARLTRVSGHSLPEYVTWIDFCSHHFL